MATGFATRLLSRPLRFRLLLSLFHAREPCRQGRKRSRAPTSHPSSKRHALPSQTYAPFSPLSIILQSAFFWTDDPDSQYRPSLVVDRRSTLEKALHHSSRLREGHISIF